MYANSLKTFMFPYNLMFILCYSFNVWDKIKGLLHVLEVEN